MYIYLHVHIYNHIYIHILFHDGWNRATQFDGAQAHQGGLTKSKNATPLLHTPSPCFRKGQQCGVIDRAQSKNARFEKADPSSLGKYIYIYIYSYIYIYICTYIYIYMYTYI